MALTSYTDGYSQAVGVVTMQGSWDGNANEENLNLLFEWGYVSDGGFGSDTSSVQSDDVSGSYSRDPVVDPDRDIKFRAKIKINGVEVAFGNVIGIFRTYANEPSAGTPVVTNITNNSADVSCTFDPGVPLNQSTFVVVLQYRPFGSTAWTNFGSSVTSGLSVSAALTGLSGGTTYQVRLLGTRTTANTQTWESVHVSFVTLASAPSLIQTDPASSVAETSANLNGTVNPAGIASRVRFGWGTSDGGGTPGSWTNLTAYQNFSGSTNQAFQQAISGLTPSTVYFFRAFVEWPSPGFGNVSSGITRSFTTPGTPPPPPVGWEDQMHLPQYDGHYGVQTDIYFTLQSPSATSNDRFVTDTVAALGLNVAGDIKISKDGGALANATNIPTQVTAGGGLYKLVLTATEMQAELILVQIIDTNGPQFRDLYILVRTKERLGQSIINASQIGSSASAMQLQPSAGGYGLRVLDDAGSNIGKIYGFLESMALRVGTARGGTGTTIDLDTGADTTNDYYNGDVVLIVGGAGAGQSRVITDYAGGTQVATVGSNWLTNPTNASRYVILPGARTLDTGIAELTGIPAAGASAGQKLQFCFQRFAFKIDQSATTQRMYKSDSSTILGSRSVSDDGSIQTVGKI